MKIQNKTKVGVLILTGFFILLLPMASSHGATWDVIDGFIFHAGGDTSYFPYEIPEGFANHIWTDVFSELPAPDHPYYGVFYPYDTGTVFWVIAGKGVLDWEIPSTLGPIDFMFSASKLDSLLPKEPGELKVRFIDILDPGYDMFNPATWVWRTVPAANISVRFDSSQSCVGDTPGIDAYSIGAYTDSNETGEIAKYTGEGTYHFSHIDGIFELAFHTDYCETYMNTLILYDWGDSRIGDDVTVQCKDETSGNPIASLTFSSISDTGMTSVASSTTGPEPPTGYQSGSPARFFSVDTAASYSGTVEICFKYGDVSYSSEADMQLYHYEDGSAVWHTVTSMLDPVEDIICGEVDSLSIFAAFEPEVDDSNGDGDDDDDGGGGGCFIATAAYGSQDGPHVSILRKYRDEHMLTNRPGRWLVARYYEYSPPAARWLEENTWAQGFVRILLLPVIGFAWLTINFGNSFVVFGTLLVLSLIGGYRFYFREKSVRRV